MEHSKEGRILAAGEESMEQPLLYASRGSPIIVRSNDEVELTEDDEDDDHFASFAIEADWYKRLKYELKWENLWHNGDYPNTYGRLNWVKAFGGPGVGCWCCSRYRPNQLAASSSVWTIVSPRQWLWWRLAVFTYLMGVFLYSALDAWGNGTWFYYLTNWQTLLFALYGLSALVTCAWIQWSYWGILVAADGMDSDAAIGAVIPDNTLPNGRRRSVLNSMKYHLPWLCRLTWMLHGFAMSLGMWVTFMFWCGIPVFKDDFDWTQIIDHVTTMVVLVVDFSLAAFPWLLLQFVWSAMVALTYFMWTIIHYALGLGNKFEEEDSRRIYPVIDWARPWVTLAIVLPLIFICIPAFSFLVWILSSESVGGPRRIVPWSFQAVEVKQRRLSNDDETAREGENHNDSQSLTGTIESVA